MALTTTQVNQAFLGLLGRPATGAEAAKFAGQLDAATLAQTLLTDASFKTQLSLEAPSFKTVDLLNTDPAAFVESLYTALLGRASDAEGKAFWLSVAGATPNRADVVSQFIAAVQAQEGTADANAFASIQAEDKALASAWVESLYNNLAGRASDAEGLDFWTNAIVSFTMTPAQVAASFAAALALQGNTTEDGQNFAAKLGVADNFTANFKDFNSLVTANEKAEQLKNLVTMMNGVNKDSQVEQYAEEITKNVNEFQNIAAVQFTTKDDDDLGIDPETGESNLSGAANFTGTYNLTDATKGTIQSSDRATGTEAYLTDTLTVNVTGYDKTTHSDFDLGELPGTTSVEKLIINNGAANVNDGNGGTGSINADFQYINVNGTGSFNIKANTTNTDGLKDIVLNSAAGKENNFENEHGKLVSLKTGAGDDTVKAGLVSKSLSTGAGKDDVTASLAKGATADLGAGDDKFNGYLGESAKLNAGAGDDVVTITGAWNKPDKKGNPISNIEIDLGTGDDKLDLSTITATNFTGIKSIKGTETIKVGNGTTLVASAVSGQKIALEGDNLVLNAATSSTVDLSKFTNADGEDVRVKVDNVKTGTVTLETGDKNFNAIKETIVLAKDAGKVTIKGLESANDKIEIAGTKVNNAEFFTKTAGTTTGVNTTDVKADNIYFVNLKEKVTKAEINKLLDDKKATFSNLSEKDVFYIIATDSATGGENRSSTAKIYKIEVGKDLKVAKLDQTSSITVANKGVLEKTDVVEQSSSYVVSVKATGASQNYNLSDTTHSGLGAKVDATGLNNNGTLTFSGGSNTQDVTIETAAGKNLTINFSGGTTSGQDSIAKSITAGAGDENIVIGGSQRSTSNDLGAMTHIDGGKGNNTLTLASNAALENLESIKNINLIDASSGAGLISAKALNGVSTTIKTDGQDLLLWGYSKYDSGDALDLRGLVSNGGNNDKITLNGLGRTKKIDLNKDDAIAETIVLENASADWGYPEALTITGLASKTTGDKISIVELTTGATSAGTGLASGTGIIVSATDADKITLAEAKTAITSGTASGGAFIVAKDDNSSAVYLVNDDFTTSATSVNLTKLVSFNGVAEFMNTKDIVIA